MSIGLQQAVESEEDNLHDVSNVSNKTRFCFFFLTNKDDCLWSAFSHESRTLEKCKFMEVSQVVNRYLFQKSGKCHKFLFACQHYDIWKPDSL